MKNLPIGLQQSLANGLTHLCHCWHITRADGTVFGLTNHNEDIALDGQIYRADAAIRFSVFETRLGLAAHGPEVAGNLGSDLITEADLRDGRYDDAAFSVFLVDWKQPQNHVLVLSGYFGAVEQKKGRFRVSLRGTGQQLNQPQGRVYQTQCDAALGDARCRVNLEESNFQWRGEVILRDGAKILLPELNFAADWFADGKLYADGMTDDFIIRHDKLVDGGRRLVLWQTPPAKLQAGTMVTLIAGCDKKLATCQNKFSNAINFQGFPNLPDGRVLIDVRS
ncbi:MAG: DUF2163 domain-containing protein [Parvibaculales bacterium]